MVNKYDYTFQDIQNSVEIRTYITQADASLIALGFTEHSFAHVTRVAETAKYILETLGYSEHEVELARIAGFMHDIGNVVNRVDHSQSGAVMAFRILDKLGMPAEDIATVVTAIGNHDEGHGVPVNAIAAALILADKSDVRRTRVRNQEKSTFDIHDRVNYSVEKSVLKINEAHTLIKLKLTVDTHYSSVMDYFEIFLERMTLCRKAAEGFDRPSLFWEALEKRKPDLVLLDIMLPEEDGIQILQKLRQREDTKKLPVIMLTAKGSEYDKVMGLESGADDYVSKPFGMMELLARVKALLRRTEDLRPAQESRYVIGDLTVNRKRHEVFVKGEAVTLTKKEFDMLCYLLENKGMVLTRDQLLNQIWGYDFDGENRTVDVHIRTLRQKLSDCGTYIETIRGIGYKIGGNP